MKLATIRTGDGRERVAVVLDGGRRLLDLGSAHERVRGAESAVLGSMLALIEGGETTLERARQLVEAAPEEAMVGQSAVTLLAPIPVPPQIRDFLASRLIGRSFCCLVLVRQADSRMDASPRFRPHQMRGASATMPPLRLRGRHQPGLASTDQTVSRSGW